MTFPQLAAPVGVQPAQVPGAARRPARLGRLPFGRKLGLLLAVAFLPYAAVAAAVPASAGVVWGFGGLAAICCFWLCRRFQAAHAAALQQVQELMADIERGRLDRVRHQEGSGDWAPVCDGLQRLATRLSAIVADVRTSAALVEQAGQDLARGQRDLATRTEQQASSLEETAASVQQLAGTVQQNAKGAADADAEAARVRSAAEGGASSMEDAVRTVGAIQGDTLRVRELVGLIDHIAFQTNVLALNAAVEAARAGEQGRGFGVVAAEVRRLAQRCAHEARNIRALVETSATHVDGGVKRIRAAGEEIASIVDGVRSMAAQMSRISTASTEQSVGLGEITRAVRHLEAITQSNSQMADESARQAGTLRERAASLSRTVRHFKLMQGTASEALELVARAQQAFRASSRESFLRAITDPGNRFHDRDMYVFALDHRGAYLAFGGNPAKVGTRVQDIPGVDGDRLLKAIVQQAEREPGWVEYDIVNPLNRQVQPKMSYVVKLGDLYVGCGVYKSLAVA